MFCSIHVPSCAGLLDLAATADRNSRTATGVRIDAV